MERRTFVKLSAAAGLASCLPISCMNAQSKPKYKMGFQLYSVRDAMEKDPVATIKALKEMGYEDFEHFGFDADGGTYYGYPATDFKAILDDMGLGISSGHYGFTDFLPKAQDDMLRFTEKVISGAQTMGSKYIVWPWTAPEYRTVTGFARTAELLNLIGSMIKDAGMGLAYHNHGFDFEDMAGINGWEIVTKQTDPELVKLQLDLYWVSHSSKQTALELISQDPSRYVMWHIKDMHKESRDYTELGNGSIDYKNILPQLDQSALEYYYVEQGGNYTYNSMESAKFSAAYLKKELQKYL